MALSSCGLACARRGRFSNVIDFERRAIPWLNRQTRNRGGILWFLPVALCAAEKPTGTSTVGSSVACMRARLDAVRPGRPPAHARLAGAGLSHAGELGAPRCAAPGGAPRLQHAAGHRARTRHAQAGRHPERPGDNPNRKSLRPQRKVKAQKGKAAARKKTAGQTVGRSESSAPNRKRRRRATKLNPQAVLEKKWRASRFFVLVEKRFRSTLRDRSRRCLGPERAIGPEPLPSMPAARRRFPFAVAPCGRIGRRLLSARRAIPARPPPRRAAPQCGRRFPRCACDARSR